MMRDPSLASVRVPTSSNQENILKADRSNYYSNRRNEVPGDVGSQKIADLIQRKLCLRLVSFMHCQVPSVLGPLLSSQSSFFATWHRFWGKIRSFFTLPSKIILAIEDLQFREMLDRERYRILFRERENAVFVCKFHVLSCLSRPFSDRFHLFLARKIIKFPNNVGK